ncbi:Acidic nuclear phosphoprotein 32 family member A [Balamuthia mandrillaris]
MERTRKRPLSSPTDDQGTANGSPNDDLTSYNKIRRTEGQDQQPPPSPSDLFETIPVELKAFIVDFLSRKDRHALRRVSSELKAVVDQFGGCPFCHYRRHLRVCYYVEDDTDMHELDVEGVSYTVELYPVPFSEEENSERESEKKEEEEEDESEEEDEDDFEGSETEEEEEEDGKDEEYRREGISNMKAFYSFCYYQRSCLRFKRELIPMDRRDVRQLYQQATALLQSVSQMKQPEPANEEGGCKRRHYRLACKPLGIIETDIKIRTESLTVSGVDAEVKFDIPVMCLGDLHIGERMPESVEKPVAHFAEPLGRLNPNFEREDRSEW